METSEKVRVRFAPSPTGYLHVGGLRTALYNYLFARKLGGTNVLRIEDTDRSRFVPGAVEKLIGTLHAVGLDYEEGPIVDIADFPASPAGRRFPISKQMPSENYPGLVEVGESGPYIQSERLERYRKYAEELIASGKAYRCFCTAQRLEEMRAAQMAAKKMPKYDRLCRSLSPEEVRMRVEAGESSVIRMDVDDDREIVFDDMVRGQVSFRTETIDDQVLLKSDGFPTYHLANVIDDHLMGITHVIRAEEWLPSTPKHILLYEALGWEAPAYAHLPLLLNPDRSKLSKRQGDVAVEDYLGAGYLRETLINFVALLGWNPGEGNTQEIFSLEELVERFDIRQVHKAGAVFDLKKLDWMNAEYIKRFSIDELHGRIADGGFLEKTSFDGVPAPMRSAEYLKNVLCVERDRLVKLSDFGPETTPYYFTEALSYDPALLRWKENSADETIRALSEMRSVIERQPEAEWTRETLGTKLLEAAGEKRGDFLWPLRVALCGERKSPPPQDLAWVIGKIESLSRIDAALEKCRE